MAIVLVRHGETVGNKTRVMQRPDIPLSETGIQQAERLAVRLATLGVGHILASDLVRAQMTAAPLSARTGLIIEPSPLLAERNFGELRGTPYAALREDPFAVGYTPPGGESWEAFHARVANAFALICTRRREVTGNLVVISHGLVCRAILERHVTVPADSVLGPLDNTAVSIFDDEAPYHTQRINCCVHLDPSITPNSEPAGIA